MKTKSIGFGEAVRSLAAEAGMQPYRFANFDKKKDLRFQTYKNIFKDYLKYFHHQLFIKENQDAFNYLAKRGVKKNIIENFEFSSQNQKYCHVQMLQNNDKILFHH